MRALVERVHSAEVTVDGQVMGKIGPGLLVYVGVAVDDDIADVQYLADKIPNLRIFTDNDGKMNLNVQNIQGSILLISAFALQADARKGRRPSFDAAAGPDLANRLYEQLGEELARTGLSVARGVFRAHMHVKNVNDGPICVLLDSKRLF